MAQIKKPAAAKPTQQPSSIPSHAGGPVMAEVIYAPEIAGRPKGQSALPRVPYAPPYYLAHHPEAWHVFRGQVVPRLRKIPLTPGAGGVDLIGGRPAPKHAMSQVEEEGWTILPWDPHNYLRPTGTGGWVSAWEKLFPGSDKTHVDEDGYADWCAGLVTRGTVPEATDHVLARLQEELESLVGRYMDSAKNAYTPKIEKIKTNIAAVKMYREKVAANTEALAPRAGVPEIAE